MGTGVQILDSLQWRSYDMDEYGNMCLPFPVHIPYPHTHTYIYIYIHMICTGAGKCIDMAHSVSVAREVVILNSLKEQSFGGCGFQTPAWIRILAGLRKTTILQCPPPPPKKKKSKHCTPTLTHKLERHPLFRAIWTLYHHYIRISLFRERDW